MAAAANRQGSGVALMAGAVGRVKEMGSGDRGGSLTRHPPAPHTPYSTFMDTVCARYDAFVGYAAPSSLVGVQHVWTRPVVWTLSRLCRAGNDPPARHRGAYHALLMRATRPIQYTSTYDQ